MSELGTPKTAGDYCPLCGKRHSQADTDGGRCTRCLTMLCGLASRESYEREVEGSLKMLVDARGSSGAADNEGLRDLLAACWARLSPKKRAAILRRAYDEETSLMPSWWQSKESSGV